MKYNLRDASLVFLRTSIQKQQPLTEHQASWTAFQIQTFTPQLIEYQIASS